MPQHSVESTVSTSSAQASGGTTGLIGSNPCSAPIACVSMKDLRLKGSSFLRNHASKHGIPNASRKLTSQVLRELRDHYTRVHRIHVLEDDYKEVGAKHHHHPPPPPPHSKSFIANSIPSMSAVVSPMTGKVKSINKKKLPLKSANCVGTARMQEQPHQIPLTSLLPQYPVPLGPLQLPQSTALHQQQQPSQHQIKIETDTNASQLVEVHAKAKLQKTGKPTSIASGGTGLQFPTSTTTLQRHGITGNTVIPRGQPSAESPSWTHASQPCNAPILVRTRVELTSFGTSLLRPEAASHKVHNASRKPKDLVVDELWRHYVTFHAKDVMVSAATEPGWVGNVIDDEEDAK